MVSLSPALKEALSKFLDKVSQEVPVSAAYLFGSAARGDDGPDSDVDVAIVSEAFRVMRRVDVITLLMSKTRGSHIDIQPIGLTPEDLDAGEDYLAQSVQSEGVLIV